MRCPELTAVRYLFITTTTYYQRVSCMRPRPLAHVSILMIEPHQGHHPLPEHHGPHSLVRPYRTYSLRDTRNSLAGRIEPMDPEKEPRSSAQLSHFPNNSEYGLVYMSTISPSRFLDVGCSLGVHQANHSLHKTIKLREKKKKTSRFKLSPVEPTFKFQRVGLYRRQPIRSIKEDQKRLAKASHAYDDYCRVKQPSLILLTIIKKAGRLEITSLQVIQADTTSINGKYYIRHALAFSYPGSCFEMVSGRSARHKTQVTTRNVQKRTFR